VNIPSTGDEGFPALYEQLLGQARRALARERSDHTLSPTALVHEAYLRLGPDGSGTYQDRAHFLAVAAAAMRHILVDHARARGRDKRGGGWTRIDLDESIPLNDQGLDRALILHDLLERLTRVDDDAAMITQMRFFGAMTEEEIAAEMGRSSRWVRKQWAFARQWLRARLDDTEAPA
jgi:RNA polymerase sigma factor (TIGR02999 family)